MKTPKNVAPILTWLAGIMIVMVVIIFPLGYLLISYQQVAGSLETEAEINARLISQIISLNPEMWEFQQLRIQEYILRRPGKGQAEIRRVLNAKNELIIESVDALKKPLIMHSHELMDSGIAVGRIEIYRSLRPLLKETGFLVLVMLPFGFVTFLLLRNLPIRAIYRSEEALRSSEKVARQFAQENAIVAEIGRIISSTLDINEEYEKFGEEVRKVIPFDRIVINIVNHEADTITTAYVTGVNVDSRLAGAVIQWSGSATQEVFHSKSRLLIQTEDIDELAVRFPALLPHFHAGFRSFMALPLIYKGNVIGVIHLQSIKPNTYTERDLRLAERVSNQIAGAIANAQLFTEQMKAEEERKKLISRLQETLGKVRKLSGLLPICASCKKIRDDKGYWNQMEAYIRDHSEAEFSHGICPECFKKLYPDLYEEDKIA